ncbi:MAG: hypothetical protein ACREGE_04210 [Candidatus Microsaccharimonas sp.]
MNPEYPYQPQPQTPQQPMQPGQTGQPGQTFSQPFQQSQQPFQQAAPHDQFATPGTPQPAPQPGFSPVPPSNLPPVRRRNPAKKWVIMTFVFIFTTLAVGGVAGWSYVNYLDQKNNVDSKISSAVAIKEKEVKDAAAAEFLEKEKQPNRQFVGPDDYGRLSFDYPKTWSVYEAKSATTGGTYEAYFNPVLVPTVSEKQQFALHVTIEDKDYDKVVDTYKQQVSKGELISSAIKFGEQNGTRLDGSFSKDIRGFAVIFKIRDKTVTVRSDAETFKDDFNKLIQTIEFNR